MEFSCEETPISITCHPSTPSIAAFALIDGSVSLISFDYDESTISFEWTRRHKSAVRRIRFSESGSRIYSITQNKALTLWDTVTGKKSRCLVRAHSAAPFSLVAHEENLCITGDEKGVVSLFDWRTHESEPAIRFDQPFCDVDPENPVPTTSTGCSDTVTSLNVDSHGKTILATCLDGRLYAFSLKAKKFMMISEMMHSELYCSAFTRNESKLLCGSEDGHLEMFSYGEWANICGRIDTTHSESVDSLVSLSELGTNVVCTGSADGDIKLHHTMPAACLGVLGEHEGGVEEICANCTQERLVSCGFDDKIKFWSLLEWKESLEKIAENGPAVDHDLILSNFGSSKAKKRRKKLTKKRNSSESDHESTVTNGQQVLKTPDRKVDKRNGFFDDL